MRKLKFIVISLIFLSIPLLFAQSEPNRFSPEGPLVTMPYKNEIYPDEVNRMTEEEMAQALAEHEAEKREAVERAMREQADPGRAQANQANARAGESDEAFLDKARLAAEYAEWVRQVELAAFHVLLDHYPRRLFTLPAQTMEDDRHIMSKMMDLAVSGKLDDSNVKFLCLYIARRADFLGEKLMRKFERKLNPLINRLAAQDESFNRDLYFICDITFYYMYHS